MPWRGNIDIFIRQTAYIYALTAERSTDIDVLDFLLGGTHILFRSEYEDMLTILKARRRFR